MASQITDIDFIFNSLLRLATKKTPQIHIAGPLWGESIRHRRISLWEVNNVKSGTITWRHNDATKPALYDIAQDPRHYDDVKMGAMASQITSLTLVYSIVYSDADQRKHQSSTSLAFVRGIHREPVNSPHKWPVTRKMFPFDDVIMVPLYMRFVIFCATILGSE